MKAHPIVEKFWDMYWDKHTDKERCNKLFVDWLKQKAEEFYVEYFLQPFQQPYKKDIYKILDLEQEETLEEKFDTFMVKNDYYNHSPIKVNLETVRELAKIAEEHFNDQP